MDCLKCERRETRLACLECEQKRDAQLDKREDHLDPQIICFSKDDPVIGFLEDLPKRQKIKVAVYLASRILKIDYKTMALFLKVSERTIKRYVSMSKKDILIKKNG